MNIGFINISGYQYFCDWFYPVTSIFCDSFYPVTSDCDLLPSVDIDRFTWNESVTLEIIFIFNEQQIQVTLELRSLEVKLQSRFFSL